MNRRRFLKFVFAAVLIATIGVGALWSFDRYRSDRTPVTDTMVHLPTSGGTDPGVSPAQPVCNEAVFPRILENSELLALNNVEIDFVSPAEDSKPALAHCIEGSRSKVWLLTKEGPKELSPNSNFLDHLNESDRLVAFTKDNTNLDMKWHAAFAEPSSVKCFADQATHKLVMEKQYSLTGLETKYKIEAWKRTDESEHCTQYGDPWNRLKPDPPRECLDVDAFYEINKDSSCKLLNELAEPNLFDDSFFEQLDYKAYEKAFYVNAVFGILDLNDSTKKEHWLVLDTPPYEWSALTTALLNEDGTLNRSSLKMTAHSWP